MSRDQLIDRFVRASLSKRVGLSRIELRAVLSDVRRAWTHRCLTKPEER